MMTSFINRSKLYFKNIWLDYYEVFKDTHKNARARPLRASAYGLATVFVLNLFRSNEDIRSFNAEVISACDRLGAVVESSRNPISNNFVQDIAELNCHGLLRQIDLGFSTLIYTVDSSPDLAIYKSHCSYLKPTLKEHILEHLVDLGFLGHWVRLEMNMKDYDINNEEYEPTVLNSVQTLGQSD